MGDTAAIDLAAGLSRRMGEENKLLLSIGDDILLRRVVMACTAVTDFPVTVVVGYQEDAVRTALRDEPVVFVRNSRFEEEQMTSVDAGLQGAPSAATYLIALGDQPKITSDCLRELLDAHHATAGERITVPMVGGIRGNPIVIPAVQRAQMLAGPINLGCRKLTRNSPKNVHLFTTTNNSFVVDIDTPADLALARTERSPQRMHAIRAQWNIMRCQCRCTAQGALQADETISEPRIITDFDVVTRQAGVGTHRSPVLGRGVPVIHHGLQHETGQIALFPFRHVLDALPVVRRDIDRSRGHDLARRIFYGLVFNHFRPHLQAMTRPV